MIDQLQAVLDTGAAVRNFREIVLAENFLVFEAEGAVVGRDYLQVVVLQAVPELGLVLFGAQGRREDVFGAFEIGAVQFFDGEQQVLRAGLGEGGDAAVAGFADFVERVFGREVHDVDGGAGDLGHGDGAVYGLGFGARRTGEGVIDGRGLAFGEGAGDDDVDHAAVFGVHADERAVFGGLGKRFENGGVVDHQHVGV